MSAARGSIVEIVATGVADSGWTDREAFVEGSRSWTFGEVLGATERAAEVYRAHGVVPGDRVVLALPDSLAFVAAFLGAIHAGAIPLPLNIELHDTERDALVERSKASAVVALAPGSGGPSWIPAVEFDGSPPSRVTVDPVPRPLESPAFGVFTSGTTGAPKIVFHSHTDPLVTADAVASHLGVGPGDVTLSASRLYFAYGLGNSLFFTLLKGSTAVLSPERLTPESAARFIAERRVSVLYGQPSFFARILDAGRAPALSALRVVVAGGEGIPVGLEQRLAPYVTGSLVEVFGTTELGHAVIATPLGSRRPGWTGRILEPYRARLLADDGAEVEGAGRGRLEISGPTLSQGVAVGDVAPRWDSTYLTGDLAERSSDGWLRVIGRLDDLEIVGGQNVHPAEIEGEILGVPDVADAVVFSRVDPSGISVLHAQIVPAVAEGGDARSLPDRITEHLRARLTWYKVPGRIQLVAEIPRTTFGKVARRSLREGTA